MADIKLNTIEEALRDFAEGKMVIVVDDEDRENEGDLIVAAEKITPRTGKFHAQKTPVACFVPRLPTAAAASSTCLIR